MAAGAKLMPCGPSNVRTADCRYALFIPLLPRCFSDAAVIRNYRDNHTYLYSEFIMSTLPPRWRRPWSKSLRFRTEPGPVKITP